MPWAHVDVWIGGRIPVEGREGTPRPDRWEVTEADLAARTRRRLCTLPPLADVDDEGVSFRTGGALAPSLPHSLYLINVERCESVGQRRSLPDFPSLIVSRDCA